MRLFCRKGENVAYFRRITVTLILLVIFAAFFAIQSFATSDDRQYTLKICDEGKPYLYGSRYQCQLTLRTPEDTCGTQRIYWNAPEIINLTCVLENEYHSISTYCMDGVVSQPIPGKSYSRINLEDWEKLRGDTGGRLRAVLLGSFPYRSVEEIEISANEIVGEGQIRQLTQGEVLAATQQAIWTIGSGGEYAIDRNYVSIRGITHYDFSEFVYPESLQNCTESQYTWGNIQNLYCYFLEMEPMDPIKEVISAEPFRFIECVAEQKVDGLYIVKIFYEIAGEIDREDELTLTLCCADQMHSMELNRGSGSCVFTDLTQLESIMISVNGYLEGNDVYLFRGEESGCDLIGYDDSRMPVSILRRIEAEDIRLTSKVMVDDENMLIQTEEVPTFTVEVNRTEWKIRTLFRILGGGFILIAIALMAIGLFSELRRRM